jgi:pilus assembly protein Flp/PilA
MLRIPLSWFDDKGATAIEYGLIAALIAVAAMVSMSRVGAGINATFTTVSSSVETVSGS